MVGSHTRLLSNGEVKLGGERRTIGIDGRDLYLIIWSKRQVLKGDGVRIGWQPHLFPLSSFVVFVLKEHQLKEHWHRRRGKSVNVAIGRAAVTFWNRMLKCWMGIPPSSLCRRGTETVFLSTFSCCRDRTGMSGSPANRKWSSNHFALWFLEATWVGSSSFTMSFIYSVFIREAT